MNENSKKNFRGQRKVCDEMKQTRKNDARVKMLFMAGSQKTGGNDLHELLRNDCGYNEGTICVLSG